MKPLVRASAILAAMVAAAPLAQAQTTVTTTITRESVEPYRLTPEQRTTVYRTVTRERHFVPGAFVRTPPPPPPARYEIGAPIPPGVVELSDFPEDVYVGVPVLRRFRYVYVNNQLVLVDPATSEVVDIITE
jgi:hypothetical protein